MAPALAAARSASCAWQGAVLRCCQRRAMSCCSLPAALLARPHAPRPPRALRRRVTQAVAADGAPEKGVPRVVIVGGTGRVGRSAAVALAGCGAPLALTLAGRDAAHFQAATAAEPALRSTSFVACDVEDQASLAAALRGADLVVHAAGPFQRQPRCAVLEAAIAARVPYLDVCDDTEYAQRAKAMQGAVAAAGIRAVTCGGMFPGVSNVMAAQLVRLNTAAGDAQLPPKRVLYSYFTAGSGGAGTTILATSFLLCGEEVTAYKDGAPIRVPPVTGRRVVDFGKGVGKRETFLYNLPEVATTHAVLGAPNVSARFGTSPGVWNGAMALMARLLPRETLQNRDAALAMARAVEPLVRAVDGVVGELTSMRVDADLASGAAVTSLFTHKRLSVSVGHCVAAFARDLLEHPAGEATPAGVFFPEEEGALGDAAALLKRAATGTSNFQENRASWQLESKSVQLGFGLFWD